MERKNTAALITSLAIPLSLALYPSTALAEEMQIGIFPTVTKLSGKSGDTVEATIQIINSGKSSVTLTPLLQPFTASVREDGTVQYIQDVPQFFRSVHIQDAGVPLTDITLAPKEEKSLTVLITIPQNSPSQDQYFSVIMMSKPTLPASNNQTKSVSANSSLTGGIATHFLLAVNPLPNQKLKLSQFSSPSFSTSGPVGFTVRVTNEDNHFSQVHGQITIKNVIGKTVDEVIIPKTVILSKSTRALANQAQTEKNKAIIMGQNTKEVNQMSSSLISSPEKDLFPGIYKAQVALQGENLAYPITSTIYFTVAPLQLIFGIVILLTVLYLVKKRITQKLG